MNTVHNTTGLIELHKQFYIGKLPVQAAKSILTCFV